MNSNLNRQFILLDFELLDDSAFLRFVSKAEFAAYLVLRRYIWRGGADRPHFLDLHRLYEEDRLLVCSLSNEKLAEKLGYKEVNSMTKPLTRLEEAGVIRRIRTGRQSIFVLGEWFDYSEGNDGSKRMEWFYLERRFGLSDPSKSDGSDPADETDQSKTDGSAPSMPKGTEPAETDGSNSNREENKETNTVTGNGRAETLDNTQLNRRPAAGENPIRRLPNLEQSVEQTEYLASEILKQFGDSQSRGLYALIAAKVPAEIIFQNLAEIRQDRGVKKPAAVFTQRMKTYARRRLAEQLLAGKHRIGTAA